MKDIYTALFVSITLVSATAPNAAFAQAPAVEDQEGRQALRLELDTSAVGDRAMGLDGLLREQLTPVFAANGAELVESETAPLVRVRIGGNFKDIELFEYELHFELVEGDKVTKLMEPVACEECYDDVIVPTVARYVPALLEAVAAAREVAQASGDGDPGDGDGGDGDGGDGDGDVPSQPPPKPIGPLGIAGAVVAGLGVGAVIGGAVELSRGRVFEQDASFYEVVGKDHRPVGYVLVGLGAAATVTGLVILGVDVGRRAKLRKQARSQVFVIPSISPANAGVGIVGRF